MKNGIYLLCCASLLLCLGACKRYTTTRTYLPADTTYTHNKDSVEIKPDSAALEKVKTEIETVFMEVEKDCPNIPKEKTDNFRKRTLNACTMESLTGGELKAHSPDFRYFFRMVFKGNEPTIIWDIQEREIKQVIEDKTVKEISFFRKVLDTWPFWAFPWGFFLLWLFIRFRPF